MSEIKHWYYQQGGGRAQAVAGPLSLGEMASLIQRGVVRSSTQVRFVTDERWHAASEFLLLKPLLERTASDGPSSRTKPVLAGLVAAILVLTTVYLLTGRGTQAGHPGKLDATPQSVTLAGASNLTAPGIIECTNRVRAEQGGLPPLSRNKLLDTVASERAEDMLRKQYFAHYSPSGEGATDVAQKTGYPYRHLGENIAMGSFQNDEKMVMAWMQSPTHRRNILSDDCSEIGVAVKRGRLKGEEVWVAVQVFGEQAPPVTTEPAKKRSAAYASANAASHVARECQAPDASLLDNITTARAELSDLSEQASSLHKEILAERSDRRGRVDASRHNRKVAAYNELVDTIHTKRGAVQRQISDYNHSVEQYNACLRK